MSLLAPTSAKEKLEDLQAVVNSASKNLFQRELDLAIDATKRASKASKETGEAAAQFDKANAALRELSDTVAAARLVGANFIMMPANE